MDPVQNSPTKFREQREGAGYSQQQVADAIGVWRSTVQDWERGRAPSLGEVRRLAQFFNTDLDDVTQIMWRERPEDPDPCPDRRGVKIYPDNEKARHLYVKSQCENCGKTMITHRWKGETHSEFCRECRWESWATSPKLKCRGDFVFKTEIRAPKCEGDRRISERERKRFRYDSIDRVNGTYICRRCAAAGQFYRRLEKNVKLFLRATTPHWSSDELISGVRRRDRFLQLTGIRSTNKAPHRDELKIQSLDRLRQLIRACHLLSAERPEGAAIFYGSRDMKTVRAKRSKQKVERPAAKTLSLNHLVAFARLGWVGYVKGYCRLCSKILFSEKAMITAHRECYRKWLHQNVRGQFIERPSLPQEIPKRGRPLTPETLRKHYAWMVRYKLGNESLEKIAKKAHMYKGSVAEAISSIIERLPAPELVAPSFRARIERFRSAP